MLFFIFFDHELSFPLYLSACICEFVDDDVVVALVVLFDPAVVVDAPVVVFRIRSCCWDFCCPNPDYFTFSVPPVFSVPPIFSIPPIFSVPPIFSTPPILYIFYLFVDGFFLSLLTVLRL